MFYIVLLCFCVDITSRNRPICMAYIRLLQADNIRIPLHIYKGIFLLSNPPNIKQTSCASGATYTPRRVDAIALLGG